MKLCHLHLEDPYGNKKTLICKLIEGSIIYRFYGSDFKKDKIEKTVSLSVDRYCGVMEMFRQFATITIGIHLHQ